MLCAGMIVINLLPPVRAEKPEPRERGSARGEPSALGGRLATRRGYAAPACGPRRRLRARPLARGARAQEP